MRPTKLDAVVKARIIKATKAGMSRARAAECAGITAATYKGWVSKGRAGQEPYAAFLAEVREAERHSEEELLDLIKEHAIEDWKAASWLLKCRYQDRYGEQTKVQHEVKFTEEQARAKYRELTGREWSGVDE
jgi:transposase